MSFEGEIGPSTWEWVNDQIEEYESSGGQRGNTLRDTGLPIIMMTTRGHKSGLVRKVPLMRVEHEGAYALVASKGGAPAHPGWYHNLMADSFIAVQDGPEPFETRARLISGDERAGVVGACGRGVPSVRRIPGEDRPRDSGVHRRAAGGLAR